MPLLARQQNALERRGLIAGHSGHTPDRHLTSVLGRPWCVPLDPKQKCLTTPAAGLDEQSHPPKGESQRSRTVLRASSVSHPYPSPCIGGRRLAANAAAYPPEEPPAIKLASKGLPVAPHSGFRLFPPAPISGTFVLARITAPAARRRATIGRSVLGMWSRARMLPWVVSNPWVSCKSFTPMGKPSSTSRGVPACHLCVAASAQAVARVTSIAVKALILGLDRAISSRQAAKCSFGVTVLDSKAARTSHAESATRSALLNG